MAFNNEYDDLFRLFGVSNFYNKNSNQEFRASYAGVGLMKFDGDKVLVSGKISDSLYELFSDNVINVNGFRRLLFNTPLELGEFLLAYDSERTSEVVNAIIYGDFSKDNDKSTLVDACHDQYKEIFKGIDGDRENFVSWCKKNANSEKLEEFIKWCREKRREYFSDEMREFMSAIISAFENISNIRVEANAISILKLREYLSADLFKQVLRYGSGVSTEDAVFVPTLVGDLCSLRDIILPFINSDISLFKLKGALKKVDIVTRGPDEDCTMTIYDGDNSVSFRGWDDSFLLIFRCNNTSSCSSLCLFSNTKPDVRDIVGSGVMVRMNSNDDTKHQVVYNFDQDCIFVTDLNGSSRSQNFYMGSDIRPDEREQRVLAVNFLRRAVDDVLIAFGVREASQGMVKSSR